MCAAKLSLSSPHYEFGGPIAGPLALFVILPLVPYLLVFLCNSGDCLSFIRGYSSIPGLPAGARLASWEAFGVFCVWIGLQAALHLLLPGRWREGVVLPNNHRLTYKFTGVILP